MRRWLVRCSRFSCFRLALFLLLALAALSPVAKAAPAVSSLSPTSGPIGTSVTISGSGFGSSQGSSTVKFNGTTGTPSQWRSSSITVPVPAGATTGNVVVTVNGNASNGVTFTVSPSITSVSPTSGGIGAVVTITGTGFGATQGSSKVTFNGTAATPSSWSATSIKVSVPSGASTGNVVVTVGGIASNGVSFTVTPTPSITSLSPTSGAAGTSVTISGANFGSSQGTSTVTFNGIASSPTSWAAAKIKAPVPSGATTGNLVVTVGGSPSNGVLFTVPPAPTISGISPASGPVGAIVIISGANFGATQGSSTVKFSGTAATPSSWSATSIQVPVPSGASTGNVVVTVSGAASNGLSFTVLAVPTISSLSPTSGGVGTSVTVSGSKFGSSQGSSTITFNGITGTPTNWRNATIKVPVPTGASTGNVVVTVSGVVSNGVLFTVPLPAPVIGGISPSSGTAGTLVTISGSNFGATQGSSTVKFNGTSGTPTTWSAISIQVPVPNGATSGNIVVTVGGTSSNGVAFTVLAPPVIGSLTPSSGPVGTSVTITGSSFGSTQGSSTVTFSGVSAAVTSWSATSIKATVPATATTGSVVVTVNGLASNGVSFAVVPTPAISTLTPNADPVGAAITITGTDFGTSQGASTVTFNGTPATLISSWSSTSIMATVPAGATTGNVIVTVNSVPSNGAPFTVLQTPGITSLTPSSGPVGAVVSINGADFGTTQGSSTVSFNGTPATPKSWSATAIQVPVPASATSGNVVVTVAGVASNGVGFSVLPTPGITGLVPDTGAVGTPVTISGTNFGSTQGTSSVTFNGIAAATITSWGPGSILANVPANATTGNVVVTVSGVASNGVAFTVLPTPGITGLSPSSGWVGDSVTISGANFGSAQGGSSVTFNGTQAATITSWSSGSITAVVPGGASTGNVVVTVNGIPSSGVLFTVLPPNFSATAGSLGTSRYGHSATRLTSGKVLLTGGTTNGAASNSAEIYDPVSQTFASAGLMNSFRSQHTTTLLQDGRVLIVGGVDASQAALKSAELYDPSAQSFIPLANTLVTPRAGHTATLLGNGQVLIVGGYDPATGIVPSAELYDPATQTFVSLGNTAKPRFGHTATLLQNGQVLIAGGKTDLVPSGAYSSAEVFDPISRKFTALASAMTSAREGHAAVLLNSGLVLITGGDLPGNGSLNSSEIYNLTTGQFTSLPVSMRTARVGHTALLLNGGIVLISGGATDSGGTSTVLNSAESFDPAVPSFQPTGRMTTAREGQTSTLLNDGTVLEAGGTDGQNSLASGELYVTSLLTGLASIAISPAGSSIPLGTQKLFVATGTFTGGSQQILSSVMWSTGSNAVSVSNDSTGAGFAAGLVMSGTSISASAAGISGSTTVSVTAPVLVSLAVAPQGQTIALGTTLQFSATGTYSDGSTQDLTASVSWISLATGIAIINSSGLATGIAQGTATIQASSGAVSATTTLTVGPPALVSVVVDPSSANISLGTTQQFHARAVFSDSSSTDVTTSATWSVSPGNLASVSIGGLAMGTSVGSGSVTATFATIPGGATLSVGPAALVSISVSPSVSSIAVGSTQQFTATGTYSDASTQDLTSSSAWVSSNGSASINVSGQATGVAPGDTTITATAGTISATATLITTPATGGASLKTGRYLHSAIILNNGQILVAGGVSCPTSGSCTYLNSAELYDPVTATFNYTGSLTTARSAPAVLLPSGKVLVAGGYTCDNSGNCSSLNSAELYNPSSDTFSAAGTMSAARSSHTMTLLNNGKVLIAGGLNCTSASSCVALNTAETYDPSTGTFTALAGQMSAARFGASAVALTQGKVLIAGGSDGSTFPPAAELYDQTSGSFTNGSNLNTPRFEATATLLNNGQVLVAGGSTCVAPGCPVNTAEVYDPSSNSFSYVGASPNNSLGVPRFGHTATLLTNGQVLLTGGFSSCPASCVSESSTELFDPASGTFTAGPTLSNALSQQTASLLANGTVLLIGGINGGVTLANDEWYQPSSLTPPGLVSITVTPSTISMLPSQTQQLSAQGTFSDGSTQTLQAVIWTSFSPAVASVSNSAGSSGVVDAVNSGTATVWANAGSVGSSTTVSVASLVSLAVSPSNTAVTVGTGVQFTATGTFSGGGTRDISQNVTWSVNGVPGGGATVGTISASGWYVAPLLVPSPPTVTVAAVFAGNPSLPGSTQVTVIPVVPVSVSISPHVGSLDGGDSLQFNATVLNTPNTAVTWEVNGAPGGSTSTGTISTSGYYLAPSPVPGQMVVTVSAVSQADPTKSDLAQVTLNPVILQVSPGSVTVSGGGTAQFMAMLQNTGNNAVFWQVNGITGGSPDIGTISTSGLYTAPATVTLPGAVTVIAVSQADPNQSASATVNLSPLPVSISLSPLSTTVNTNATQLFTATVQNTGNLGVTWQVNGVTGGSGTTGTISANGLYTAPATVPNPYIVTVTAISQADTTKSASATVTLTAAYYVSTTGNDNNLGTFSLPWRTIQHAASTVQAGSTVYVRAGTYSESVTLGASGSTGLGPIVFQSYPGETAIVDGTGLTPPSGIHGLFNITNLNYVTVQGFEVRNYATASSSVYPAGIWVTGSGSNIQILNNLVHNITTSAEKNGSAYGIAVYGSTTTSIDSITISGNQVYNLKTGESESVNVDGNVTNFAITNNIIHDNDNIGIDAIGFEGVAPNSSVDYARNGVITGNTIYNISAINNAGEGKDYDADGIYVDGGSQILIERNLIYNVDIGIEMASEHSGHVSSYVTTRNNVVYNSNSAGITIGGYASGVGGTDHCTIVNNTLYNNDTKNTASGEFQIQYKATNNIFENNIVYGGSQGLLVNNYTGSGNSANILDYNLYFSPLASTAAKFVWSGTTRTGFSTYQSATGLDAHSQYANPQYLSVTTPDFRVQSTSPAVNAGTNLGLAVEGTLDFAGNPRVAGGNIDIGAYEQ